MLVEDELITATDIEEALIALGYEVPCAVDSGREAIRQAGKIKPDLILMDIRLKGDIDGIDAAIEIRQRFGVPVVYLTAHADDQTLDRAKRAEPLGYIVKPFQDQELRATIEMALHKRRQDSDAKLREEELESTLTALAEGVIRSDHLGHVAHLNPAAERWTGWKGAEAQGRAVAEVFQLCEEDSGRPLEDFVRNAVRETRVVELPENAAVRSRDGVIRGVLGSVGPVLDHLDHPCGAVFAFCADHGKHRSAAPASSSPKPTSANMIAESEAMKAVLTFAQRIASSGVSTVLLQGESGVGKDVMARFLHEHSSRRDRPFLALNCAAIPETLLESEIFGYEKGAFTDARSQKKGVLDLADGGTLFLDEIGELQSHIQAKLLRVLEDQCFRRLGGVKDIQVDLRIITATNRNLADAVRTGLFREDLYYRLNVIQVAIPPLRQRRDDIRPLAEHFVEYHRSRLNRSVFGIADEALELLRNHNWPGNVRELRNVIERAMVLEDSDRIGSASLILDPDPLAQAQQPEAAMPAGTLEQVERTMLEEALRDSNGNQSEAARKLGISRDTLRYRVKKLGL